MQPASGVGVAARYSDARQQRSAACTQLHMQLTMTKHLFKAALVVVKTLGLCKPVGWVRPHHKVELWRRVLITRGTPAAALAAQRVKFAMPNLDRRWRPRQ